MIDINKLILEAMKSRDKVKSQTFKLVKAKILEFKTQDHAPAYTEEDVINFLNSHYPGKINKKEMGKVVKEIKSVLLGVDGKLASDCVKEKLEEA